MVDVSSIYIYMSFSGMVASQNVSSIKFQTRVIAIQFLFENIKGILEEYTCGHR